MIRMIAPSGRDYRTSLAQNKGTPTPKNEESFRRGWEAFFIVPGPLVGAKALEVN
jgi:hypothetical protein